MKLSIVSASVALAFGVASFQASAANDGTINFTGNVSATTCQINGQQPGQNLANVNVNLKNVSTSALAQAGDTANTAGFQIVVGGAGETACTNGSTAYVRFDPTSAAIDPNSGRLNTDAGAGAASNVQIQVLNGATAGTGTGSVIDLRSQDSQGVVIANNTATINLAAQYYATGAATAGTVASRVGYQVVFN
ncbi:fimbrial protein [Dyella sp.]|uniref:fimbrial protein n=1 Tax=Dyella sp. TaxID=1869338 RepID=UPI002D786105|nr:fimbrial protein [Dyella sp.]HET7329636.1 fimbrial protein [Dyella sp.]